ncbi:src kinase-associated phosphoprotein 2 isoform 1-T2 [Clarias gariepinus]|uniref:src kinase-associated phosphoprotein 2 n=1 Tax=Clarias gariepinus TaxID=13013 RepID=UPI00234CE1C2|nr:src kinase-associated phosphoprotein 2 [Clarias gariepinus]XP_053350812.1 src kinase-associated phosphoprotein 2 [Clarias gariepinus]
MKSLPEDLSTLVSDLEVFLIDILKGENLSKKAKEKRDAFIKRIKDVKASYPQDFKEKREEEGDEVEDADSNNDGSSLHSERTDRDEESAYDGVQQAPPVAAQDLQAVFKSGYLEKRRKDHSFFGTEWQKRWCALSIHTFYYYGNEKDKQQKGEFNITGYAVKMNNNLRKDSKKDCCFEISAPDKRVYQFCASSQREAEEWVEQISFVIKDMEGIIPLEEEQDTYDDCLPLTAASMPEPIDDDIYEELPEDEVPQNKKPAPEPVSKPPVAVPVTAVNKSTDYQNYFQGLWDCNGDQPDELTFKRGDAIYILSKEYDTFGWWVGEMKGIIGIVPKSYLTELYIL